MALEQQHSVSQCTQLHSSDTFPSVKCNMERTWPTQREHFTSEVEERTCALTNTLEKYWTRHSRRGVCSSNGQRSVRQRPEREGGKKGKSFCSTAVASDQMRISANWIMLREDDEVVANWVSANARRIISFPLPGDLISSFASIGRLSSHLNSSLPHRRSTVGDRQSQWKVCLIIK